MRKRQKQVAYHEAGHAVARLYVGAPATPVEIDGSEGRCHGTVAAWTTANLGQHSAWDQLIVLLAGTHAEARISKRSRIDIGLGGGATDYREAQAPIDWLVANRYADDEHAGWRRAERQTAEFVRNEWAAIARVATALFANGHLTAEEVLAAANATAISPGEADTSSSWCLAA